MQVAVQDAFGNTVTTSSASIGLAIGANPGGGALTGPAVAASSGLATFNTLSINKIGVGYTLVASSGSLTGATSTSFNIVPGAPSKLAFAVQPTNALAGASIAPAVQIVVQDALGNTVTTSSASIVLAIGTNPGAGSLSGTSNLNATAGVAGFATLSINRPGTGYTLSASSSGLTAATSSAFNIVIGAASRLAFTVQPSDVQVRRKHFAYCAADRPGRGPATPLPVVRLRSASASGPTRAVVLWREPRRAPLPVV